MGDHIGPGWEEGRVAGDGQGELVQLATVLGEDGLVSTIHDSK